MTRITSFGFGRRTYVASSAEEAADSQITDELPPGPVENGKKGKKRGRGDDGDARAADGNVEAGPSNGWGKDPEIIRKAQRSEQRRVGRQTAKHASTTCFACRSKGHAAKDCPNVLLASASSDLAPVGEESAGDKRKAEEGQQVPPRGMKRAKGKKGADVAGTSGRCYRCNSTQHPLSRCPRPASDGLPYANCFICLQTGHLASTCPSNPGRGVYPNGGNCKVCGSVQHRASDCPDDKRGKKAVVEDVAELELLERSLSGKAKEMVVGSGFGVGADEDDFMVVKQKVLEAERRRKPEQVKKVAKKRERVMDDGEEKRVNPVLEMAGTERPAGISVPPAPAVLMQPTVAPVKRKPKVVKF